MGKITKEDKIKLLDGMIESLNNHLKDNNKKVANGQLTMARRNQISASVAKEMTDLENQKRALQNS